MPKADDLRRTGATKMQAVAVMPNVIDRCQNHVLAGSRVRRHYLKYDYADETKLAWAKLGQRSNRCSRGPCGWWVGPHERRPNLTGARRCLF